MPARPCPVCLTPSSQARLFMERNIDPALLSSFSFASRKLPEFMCHQLVQCSGCGLVYANDPPDQSLLAQAYHAADFDSDEEAQDAAASYVRAIEPALKQLATRGSALEIGTGTGVFLDHLHRAGFKSVVGIEPSASAIAAAPAHRRAWIRVGIFKEEEHQPESYDLICCFMTLEHVLDPSSIASAASRLLRPGGALVVVTHDYRAWVNRALGRRSPIIDIEHMQLFSRRSVRTLLERNGFERVDVGSFKNRYAARYWVRLLPLPARAKSALVSTLSRLGLADIKIAANVGNLVSYGFRGAARGAL